MLLSSQACDVLSSKKLLSPGLQRAADKARSEQRSILAAYAKLEAEIKDWVSCAEASVPVLKVAIGKINDQLKRQVIEVNSAAVKVGDTFEALLACEKARIDLSGSLVCPLDALSRGFLGPDMAVFVDTLRLNARDMQLLCSSLKDLKKQLVKSITSVFATALSDCVLRFSHLHTF